MGKSSQGCGIGACSKLREAALLTKIWSNSAAITNKSGDKGSPCLTPLLHLKDFPGTPLSNTADQVPEFRMFFIQFIHMLGKPKWFLISKIAWCSTVSNAFSKSSLSIMTSLLNWWHWWMYSKLHAKQSWMVLVLMKKYWFLCTSLIITICNMSARILVSNLRLMFIKEI